MTGTIRYASLNMHLGIETSRRDDLESLGYILIYFLTGSLPWQGLKIKSLKDKVQAIMEKKVTFSIETLCKGLPSILSFDTSLAELQKYFKSVKDLKFDQTPDYQYLRRLFKDLYMKTIGTGEFMFDWTKKHVYKTSVCIFLARTEAAKCNESQDD